MIVLVIALAVLVGVALGMLGGGGSILTVPLLVYVAGMDAQPAIATSLLVVAVTSAVAAVSHARAGRVQLRTGLVFGAAGLVGAYAGGRIAHHLPDDVLLLAFAAMMIATSVAMIRGRREPDADDVPARLPVGRALLTGAGVGLVAGLVGAGGGFLVVPALALLGGLAMPVAVGTSLVVVAINSAGGLVGHLATVAIDWRLAAGVTAAAVVGALLGGRLAGRVSPARLRTSFGWFVLAMGALVVVQEVPASWRPSALGLTIAAAVAALGIPLVRRRQLTAGRPHGASSGRSGRGRRGART